MEPGSGTMPPPWRGKIRRGKTKLIPNPFPSAKVRGNIREAGISTRKVEFLALCKAKVNVGCGGNTAYFGQRSGPDLGSPEQSLN